MATLNVPADFLSIQAAVTAASAGDTILVGPGTYTENVVIDKPLTLLSSGGRGSTTIRGDGAGGELGAIQILPGVDNVTIGGAGQGFTIVGINGNGAVEKAAIYLQGNHDGLLIQGNDVVANGDAGLLSEFSAAVTNTTIDGNIFSGQTFTGAQPDGIGFSTQFNVGNNVPRQLVTLGNGGSGPYVSTDIVFTNNDVTGTAGGVSSDDNTSAQGNTLVTIDAADSTISNNDFTGFTNRFATSVRARGPNTEVSDNSFDASASGSQNTLFMFIDNKGSPANYDGNTFVATDGTETLSIELTPGGDDTFLPGGGDDDIQGGGGTDTAIFTGNLADYSIVDMGAGVVVVTDLRAGSPEGTNTLRQFERFEFADGVVLSTGPTLDLDLDDSSGAIGGDFQATFVEGGGALLLNNGDIRITDPDDALLQSAAVQLVNPLDGASDILSINAALAAVLGITAVVAGDGHSISLTGAASLASYQAVLGTVTYENTSFTPDVTDRRITFQVSDGVSDSPVANAVVAVMAVNQEPTIDLDADDSTAAGTSAAGTFSSGGAPVTITDGDVEIGDLDGTTLTSATVTLTNAADGAAESLGIDLILAGNLGLAVAFGPDDQSIAISGTADHVFYEVLLATVTYDNGAGLPTLGDRAIEVIVDDGIDVSAVATSTVTVIANAMPADDSVTVAEDSVDNDLTTALLSNDGDPEGDILTITGASGGPNGSISVAPDGTLTYSPDGDFVGTDSFVYTVTDGNGSNATATATVMVTGVNDAPVLTDPGGVEYAFGFETGALVDGGGFGWFDNGGTPSVVSSGSGGVTSDEGSFHMTVGTSVGGQQGAFTRFGGYSDTFPPGGYTTEVSIFLDLTGISGTGQGFDYSSAINDQTETHLRDFVFTVKESGGVYEIGASNNAGVGGVPNNPPTTGGPVQSISSSGWYTFRHTFVDDGGVLRVDMTVLDAGGIAIGTWSLSDPSDLIASVVGGNRYGWILNNQVPDLPVDDTARLGATGTPPVFIEDSPVGVVVNGDFIITDIDDTDMEGASVAITNFVVGEDVLQFTDMLGISGSYDSGTGVLTLTGAASIADYEAALSSVRYFNSNDGDPDTTARLIDFTVNDGEAPSAPVTIEVALQGVADDPIATDDSVPVAEDSGANDLTSALLANDNDPDGDSLTIVGATGSSNGSLNVALDGTITYTPDGDFSGSDAFTYTITDGNGGATASATATIDVTPENDAPVLDLDLDDSTAPGTGSSVTFTEGGGQVLLNDGDISISDLDGTTIESASVVLENPIDGAFETLTISAEFAALFGITAVVAGDGHSIVLSGAAAHSEYQAVLGTVRYTNASVTPSDTVREVSFSVNDGVASSPIATASVAVVPTNSLIVADLDVDDSTAPGFDAAVTFQEGGLSIPITDADVGLFDVDGTVATSVTITVLNPLDGAAEFLSIDTAIATNFGLSVVFGPNNHSITVSGTAETTIYNVLLGTVRYENAADAPDTAVREIQVLPSDEVGPGQPSTSFVSIISQADDPTAANDQLVLAEDSGITDVTAALLANDGDPDGDSVTVVAAAGAISGSVDVAPDGTVSYAPDADFNGTDSFIYTITDGNGGATATASVAVTVTSVADAPVAQDDSETIVEDSGANDLTAAILANDRDIDGDSLTVVGAEGQTNGAVDVTGGVLTYTADNDFAGTDSFTYTITDGNGGGTATATATVTVTGVNDPPVLNGGPIFGTNFDDGQLNDGSTGFFDFGGTASVAASGTNGVTSLSGGFHAVVGTSTPGSQGGAFTRWGGYESDFPAGGYTTQMAIYLDVAAHAGNDLGFTYSNALNRPDGSYRTEFYFNVGTTGDPGDGFVIGASQRANDGGPGVPAVPGPDFGPTFNVTTGGWYTFQFQASESGPGIRLDFTLLDAGGNVVATWVSDRPDLVRGVDIGGNRYGWVLSNEIPDLPVDNILKGEVAATPSVTYTEDDPPVVINDAITVDDTDDVNLEMATVTFVGGYVLGEDVLNFAGLGNITGVFDAGTGTLTLSGSDSLANYQAALQAVTYSNAGGDNPTAGTRTVRFLANDGDDDSNAVLTDIEIVPVNDAPVLDLDGDDSSGAADPDYQTSVAAGAGAVVLNDGDILLSDADDTSLDGATIALAAAPDGGDEILTVDSAIAAGFGVTVVGNGSASITLSGSATAEAYRQIFATATYENQAGASATTGAREIIFTADDGEDPATASAFVDVTVPPALDLDFDDSTAAGVDAAVTFVEGAGSVVLNDGDIRIADADGTTLDSAAVVLSNPLDGADEALSINVGLAASLGITAVISGDGHSISLTGTASHAAYQAVLGTIGYDNLSEDPDTTARTIDFTVNDGVLDSNVATATVTIDPVNQAPVVDLDADDSTAPGIDAAATFIAHHGPIGILGPDVSISDVDGTVVAAATVSLTNPVDGAAEALSLDTVLAGNLGLTVVFGPDNQSITITGAAGHLTYEILLATVRYDNAAADPSLGDRTVEVTVNDGNDDSAVAVSTITILPDPAAADDVVIVAEDSGVTDVTALLLNNDGDADADPLTVTGASGASNGTVDVAPDGTVSFTPDDDFHGTDSFTYTITDGNGGSSSASVTVTVTPVADDPVAVDDAPLVVAEDSGATDVTAFLLTNDTDADGDAVTVVGASGAANGTVDVAPDGTVDFTPIDDFHGTDSFTYTITDGNGGATATASVSVTVTPVADDPFAVDDSVVVAEDSGANDVTAMLLANDGDVDGDAVTVVNASGATNGAINVAVDGTVTFTPDGDFFGSDSFTYTITDGNGGATASATATITVTPVNDAPTLDLDFDDSTTAGADSAVVFSEGGGPVVLNDGDIRVADVDGTTLDSAAVILTNPLDGADETLSINVGLATSLGITAVVAGDGHSISLTGTASHAAYQAVLGTVRYDNLSVAPDTTSREIEMTVNDGTDDSNVATAVVSISTDDAAPTLDLDGDNSSGAGDPNVNAAFVEDGGAVVVTNGDVVLTDVDSTELTRLTVDLINPQDGASETLGIDTVLAASFGVTVVATATGIEVTGSASIAAYRALIESVTYDNGSDAPDEANRTIRFQVENGGTVSNPAFANVSVTSANDDPTADDDAIVVAEDSGANNLTGQLLAGDVDADGDSLTVVAAAGASNGSLSVLGDGTVLYTPASDFDGVDSFSYTITDGNGGATASAFATVTVTPVADDPTAADDAVSVLEDTVGNDLTASILANDVDGDGDNLTVIGVDTAANGTLNLALDGTVTYTPNGDFFGTDEFTYTITDGNGGATASATATISVLGQPDDPTAAADSVLVEEDSGANDLTALLLANDGDVDGDTLTVVGANGAANGVVDVAPDGTVSYAPGAEFNGTDSFTYTITDGNGGATASASVAVTVTAVNDDPIATDDTIVVAEDSLDSDLTLALLSNDSDPDGDSPVIVAVSAAGNGSVQVVGGIVTYSPASDYVGTDSFTYTITDGNGGATASATATITVTPVADDPVPLDDAVTVIEDSGATDLTATLLANDQEVDGDSLTIVGASGAVDGTVDVAPDGSLTFQPDADFVGTDSFVYTVTDGNGGATATAAVTVTVTPESDSPEAQADILTVAEDSGGTNVTADLLLNDSDPDGDTITVVGAGGSTNGSVNVAPDGAVTFTPDGDFHGTDAFTYTITDGNGGGTATATATVTVTPIADDPTAGDDAVIVAEDSGANDLTAALLGNDGDVDGDTLTIVSAGGAANGAVDVAPDGTVTFTPADDFDGLDSFTYTITDGNGGTTASATVSVTVTPVADDPVAGDDAIIVAEDSADNDLTSALLSNDTDADGDGLTVVDASGATNGTVNVAVDGAVTFTPNGDFAGTDVFTYTVTDGNGGATASATATVTVTGVSDDPSALDDDLAVAEDSGANDLTAQLLANDGDADGDILTVVAVSGASNGSVAVAPDGTVTFAPDADFVGTDSFTYTVTDGNGGATATATATITVTPENDAPLLDLDEDDSTAGGANFATTFTEGAGAVLLNDGDIRITDIDIMDVQAATVVLSNPLDGGDEALAINAVLAASFGITAIVAGDGHSITLSGAASATEYQAVLGTVTYENASIDPDVTDRNIAFTVNDGTVDSNIAVATVTIDPVNQAPSLDLDGNDSTGAVGADSIVQYFENGPAVALTDGDIVISDVDGPGIQSAEVTITDAADPGETLSVDTILAGNLGVTVSVLGGGTQLQLSAGGPLSDLEWQQLLQTVVYDNATPNPTGTSRSIEFNVNDGDSNSNVAVATVEILGVNDDPTAAADTITVEEDSVAVDVTALLLSNDEDVDGDTLTVVAADAPGNGSVDVAPDGTVSFTPDGDFFGTDGFTYTITDGNGGATSSATVAVTVTAVADDPTAADDIVNVAEDSTGNDLTVALLANDGDVDGDGLTVVAADGAANGSISVAPDGTVTFTPDGNYTGTDAFTYTITDGNGGATASATVMVSVTPTADDPTAVDDSLTVDEDSGANDVTAGLLVNDSDADGDVLTVVGANGASNGSVDVAPDGTVSFTPDENFVGTDAFTYTVTDGNGGATASALATITVAPTADDPVATDDAISVAEDSGATNVTVDLLSNDQDVDGDILTVVAADGAANGAVSVAGDGTVTFTPNGDFFGTDAFTYTITDGNGGATASATAIVTVTPTADDPAAADDLVAVGEDTIGNDVTAAILANDGDVDGDTLTVVAVDGGANGSVAVAPDGTVTYGPNAGYSGTDDFTYTVTDGNGGATASATVTVNVTDVNDDPLANDDAIDVAEDSVAADVTAAILANDSDADIADVLTVVAAEGAVNGTVAVAPDGTVTYEPVGDFNGSDSFTYTITDGNGGATASATATVTVTPVGDDPTAEDDAAAVDEDSTANDLTALVLSNDGDIDGDSLTVVGANGASNGSVSVEPDGTLLYDPDGGYVGTDSFTYTVTDGNGGATASATVTVAVGPVNDDPTAADDAVTVAEDSLANDLTALLLVNDGDIDGDSLTIVSANGAGNGTVAVAPDGTLTYAPDADFSGSDSFTYTITDGNGGATASATATVTVTMENDDPVANDDGPLQVTENVSSTLNVALLLNDVDPDGDMLTIVGASGATNGTLEIGPGDQLVYMPDTDYIGTDSFTYTITDGNGGATASALATINVVMGLELAIGWELFGTALVEEGDAASYTVQFNGEAVPPGQSVSIEIGIDLPGGANGAIADDLDSSLLAAVQNAIDALGAGSGISLVANRIVFEAGAQTMLSFDLPVSADETTEGLEIFTVTIANPSAGEILDFQDLQATTILDTSLDSPDPFALALFGQGLDGPPTIIGSDGADNLVATAAADVIDAGGGNDAIMAVGLDDTVRAGGGDDNIGITGASFRAIAGGQGTDTVSVMGEAVNLNLAADAPNAITGVEIFDIAGSGDNSIDLTYADLIEVAEPLGSLTIAGDAGDRVSADLSGENFAYQGVENGFHVYSNGAERLLVSEEITDQNVII